LKIWGFFGRVVGEPFWEKGPPPDPTPKTLMICSSFLIRDGVRGSLPGKRRAVRSAASDVYLKAEVFAIIESF
jgi:hypothetical protein